MTKPAILFVCLGNICRSPLAEAAFRKRAGDAGLDVEIDSAGTAAYHIGEPPDERAIAEAQRRGLDIRDYRARQLDEEDFERFDHILAMDADNLANIEARKPVVSSARITLLLDIVPGKQGRSIADPYHSSQDGFAVTWNEVDAAAEALVAVLLSEKAG